MNIAALTHPLTFSVRDVLINYLKYLSSHLERGSDILRTSLVYALHCTSEGRVEEFIRMLKEILLTYDDEVEVDEITLYKALLWTDLCFTYIEQDSTAEVDSVLSKALELTERIHSGDNYYLTLLYFHFGVVYLLQRKLASAVKMLHKSLLTALEISDESETIAWIFSKLADCYFLDYNYGSAENSA